MLFRAEAARVSGFRFQENQSEVFSFQEYRFRVPGRIAARLFVEAGPTSEPATCSVLTWQRNTYGIRCAAFAAHVRKCLRFAAPAAPVGH
jgi:hypothetical protein